MTCDYEQGDDVCSLPPGHPGDHYMVPRAVIEDLLRTLDEEEGTTHAQS